MCSSAALLSEPCPPRILRRSGADHAQIRRGSCADPGSGHMAMPHTLDKAMCSDPACARGAQGAQGAGAQAHGAQGRRRAPALKRVWLRPPLGGQVSCIQSRNMRAQPRCQPGCACGTGGTASNGLAAGGERAVRPDGKGEPSDRKERPARPEGKELSSYRSCTPIVSSGEAAHYAQHAHALRSQTHDAEQSLPVGPPVQQQRRCLLGPALSSRPLSCVLRFPTGKWVRQARRGAA